MSGMGPSTGLSPWGKWRGGGGVGSVVQGGLGAWGLDQATKDLEVCGEAAAFTLRQWGAMAGSSRVVMPSNYL